MKNKGVSAVIATILLLVITIAMAGLAYVYISGIFTRATATITLVDSYCANGEIHVFIENQGQTKINQTTVKIITVDASCTNPLTLSQDLEPGKVVELVASGCDSGRQHTFRIITPAGGVPVSVYCT
ncbi:MAG: type IV pilin [Candidatus Aenigmarchaeota archaeon]|nr:type IV pilin [Candidatus Aenigmarchaeota archaeon]